MSDEQNSPRRNPYAVIGDMWTAAGVPYRAPITEGEARRAARALWKIAGRKKVNPRIRPDWTRDGWRQLVHSLSHLAHAWNWNDGGRARPHAWNHPSWERAFTAECIKRRWHLGALKPKARPAKPEPDQRALKAARVEARLKAWRSKLKRAQTAVTKLERSQRREARKHETQAQALGL